MTFELTLVRRMEYTTTIEVAAKDAEAAEAKARKLIDSGKLDLVVKDCDGCECMWEESDNATEIENVDQL